MQETQGVMLWGSRRVRRGKDRHMGRKTQTGSPDVDVRGRVHTAHGASEEAGRGPCGTWGSLGAGVHSLIILHLFTGV